MTIKEEKALTLAEVYSLVGDSERGEEVKKFIKKFASVNLEKAMKLKEELQNLKILKLKNSHVVKIVDFAPENAIELNKVINDISLDQEEISKILNVVNKN